jgi:hypothetical protein
MQAIFLRPTGTSPHLSARGFKLAGGCKAEEARQWECAHDGDGTIGLAVRKVKVWESHGHSAWERYGATPGVYAGYAGRRELFFFFSFFGADGRDRVRGEV